jgi:DNA mismatch repair protein MutS
MAGQSANETPLMKQYNAIKAKYPGALLLFRVGDFYETFGQDAVTAARVLDIVLTKRGNGSASEIELAGFPHHALDSYLPKLVRAGHRVAICDQLEDPRFVKGIVKRGVTELVTPGVYPPRKKHLGHGIVRHQHGRVLCGRRQRNIYR